MTTMRHATRVSAAVRPYRMHLFLLVYTVGMLAADGRLHDRNAQLVLGAATLGVLWFCAQRAPRERRVELWVCVPVATAFEIFGSLIWGGYTYQFHNIPAYVPPGHALVYLFGLTAASLPLVRRTRDASATSCSRSAPRGPSPG